MMTTKDWQRKYNHALDVIIRLFRKDKKRELELEESLRDCASKLESQISRSSGLPLPPSYSESVKKAFSLLDKEK